MTTKPMRRGGRRRLAAGLAALTLVAATLGACHHPPRPPWRWHDHEHDRHWDDDSPHPPGHGGDHPPGHRDGHPGKGKGKGHDKHHH